MATAYETELTNKAFTGNVVILFKGIYFSKRAPDSGSPSPLNNSMIQSLKIQPVVVDPRTAKTSVRSYEFSITDRANILTALMLNNENVFMGENVRIFLGRNTGSFAFSDYFELPQTQIFSMSFQGETFTFKTQEAINLMRAPAFNVNDALGSAMADTFGLAAIASFDISLFPASGTVIIDKEMMTYSAKNNTTKTFTLTARGVNGTTAATHNSGAAIYNVRHLNGNPITLFLQMLTSPGGGGAYDVLTEGLGINSALVDLTALETLRTDHFSGVIFDIYLYNIPNFLTWAENEIFLPCNCRLVISNASKVTLALLDNNSFAASLKTFDNSTIIKNSVAYVVSNQKIINKVSVAYDYNDGTGNYESSYAAQDDNSIATYGGNYPVYTLKFKGVKSAYGGAAFLVTMVKRLLARFSTATPELTLQTQFDKSLALPGEVVRVKYNLPTPSGDRAFDFDLEILQSGLDEGRGVANFGLSFTAYTGLRNCFISPSDIIASVISQKKITVPAGRGAQYIVGWIMRLYTPGLGQTIDAANTITDITGDTITFQNNFSTTLTTSLGIRFANYDEVIDDQKRYGFISAGSAAFADGKTPYLISF